MQSLAPLPLTTELLPQAFPLARVFAPTLDLDSWLAFGADRTTAGGTGGIVALRDQRGYFHGLYGYQVRRDLMDGVVLEIDMAITMDLVNRTEAAAAMTSEISELSRGLGCRGVHVRLRPDQRWLRRWFERHGYEVRSVVLATLQEPVN